VLCIAAHFYSTFSVFVCGETKREYAQVRRLLQRVEEDL
jgi:hypothetical protein